MSFTYYRNGKQWKTANGDGDVDDGCDGVDEDKDGGNSGGDTEIVRVVKTAARREPGETQAPPLGFWLSQRRLYWFQGEGPPTAVRHGLADAPGLLVFTQGAERREWPC